MSAAVSSPGLPNPPPEETHISLAGLPNLLRVFSVVRIIMLYGADILERARQHPTGLELRRLTAPFGTLDLNQIRIRLLNGLRRALALEDLLRERARQRQDLVPAPIRLRGPRSAAGYGAPGCPRSRHRLLEEVRLLSDDEIKAELRDRPIGWVIAAICCDFGITALEFTPEAWQVLRESIECHGGTMLPLVPVGAHRYEAEGEIFAADPSGPELLNPFYPVQDRPGTRTLAFALPP